MTEDTDMNNKSICNVPFLNMLRTADNVVHCVVVHVSRSGMTRRWRVWIQRPDQGEAYVRELKITGCGWDQSYDVVADYISEFTDQPVNVSGWGGEPRPGDLKVRRVRHSAWC